MEPAAEDAAADDPALGGSPFAILDRRDQLRLVLDALGEGDCLCVALVCRRFRAAVFARWPRRAEGGARFRTSLLADMAAASLARYQWAFPWYPWVSGRGTTEVAGALTRRLAGLGALEALRWSREEGCGWDASACTAAAESGQLETLRWLRSQGAHLEAAPALVCRSCQYAQLDTPDDDPGRTTLVTATEFVMVQYPEEHSRHEHGQWQYTANDELVQHIHPRGSVPFYGDCSAGAVRSQVLRVRQTPEMRRRILVDTRQPPTDENTWFPPFCWSAAYCRQCQAHLGWLFTLPEDGAAAAPEGHDQPFYGLRTDCLEGQHEDEEPFRPAWEWPVYLTFATGSRVVLSGLAKNPELNGVKGVLEAADVDDPDDMIPPEFSAFDRERQRYRVRVEGRERPVNARPGAPDPLSPTSFPGLHLSPPCTGVVDNVLWDEDGLGLTRLPGWQPSYEQMLADGSWEGHMYE